MPARIRQYTRNLFFMLLSAFFLSMACLPAMAGLRSAPAVQDPVPVTKADARTAARHTPQNALKQPSTDSMAFLMEEGQTRSERVSLRFGTIRSDSAE